MSLWEWDLQVAHTVRAGRIFNLIKHTSVSYSLSTDCPLCLFFVGYEQLCSPWMKDLSPLLLTLTHTHIDALAYGPWITSRAVVCQRVHPFYATLQSVSPSFLIGSGPTQWLFHSEGWQQGRGRGGYRITRGEKTKKTKTHTHTAHMSY